MKHKILARLGYLAAVLCWVPVAHADWQAINIGGGGWFERAALDAAGHLYAASDLAGAYVSTDNGAHWSILGPDSGMESTHVAGFGMHPTNPAVFFVGTDQGVYKTTDGGLTFSWPLSFGYVETLAVANDSIVYAAFHSQYDQADGQVYKSLDGGATWFQVSTNLPNGLRILKMQVDPSNPQHLFLLSGDGRFATGTNALYRSDDGGISWTLLSGGFTTDIMDFALDPNSNTRLWVTTWDASTGNFGHLHRSDNRGGTFTEVAQHGGVIWLKAGEPSTIRLFNSRRQFPFAGEQRDGVWQSTDGGQNWSQISEAADIEVGWQANYYIRNGWLHGVAARDDTLIWVNSQAVYGSFDGGLSAQQLYTRELSPGHWSSRGIDNAVIVELEADKAVNSVLWAGFFDMGVWRSDDSGASWVSCNRVQDTGNWDGFGGNSWTILTDPDRSGMVWTMQAEDELGPAILLRSDQRGGSDCQQWMTVGAGLPAAPLLGLSLDNSAGASGPKTLYVTAAGDVYRSTDDGANWSLVFASGGMRTTAVSQDGRVYAAGEFGIYRSDDGINFTIDLTAPGMAGTVNDLPLAYQWHGISDVVPNPGSAFPDRVYAVVHGVGVYKSENSGAQWQLILADPLSWRLAVNPTDESHLLVTSSSAFDHGGYDPASQGVWESHDAGATWQNITGAIPWPFAMAVDFSRAGDHAFVGSPGAGIFRRANSDLIFASGFE